MSKSRTHPEYARYWRSPLLENSDFLTARYIEHEFAPHWHETFTVAVIEAGAEKYLYRGEEQLAPRGTLAIINPGEIHTGSRAAEEGWHYRVFYPPVAFIEQLARDISERETVSVAFDRSVVADADVVARLGYAHRLLESNSEVLLAESALVSSMGMLLRRHARMAPTQAVSAGDPRVAVMKDRLADETAAELSLTELAATAGLSAWHALRLFSRTTGLPPHAWRTQLRINRSLALLRAGLPVTQVAAETGFTDQSHFTRHFRRTFGVPPGRWQAAQLGKQ